MFREMRRFKQQISEEECIRILKEEPRGVLSMIGDDGYPYGIPISHFYSEEDGKIYFHGAKVGHKIDAITQPAQLSVPPTGQKVADNALITGECNTCCHPHRQEKCACVIHQEKWFR